MHENHRQASILRSICYTSASYARHFIPLASLPTLQACLKQLQGRPHTKTLSNMIQARINRLQRGRDQSRPNNPPTDKGDLP